MSRFATRLTMLAIFSMALIAAPAMTPAFASAGDPPVATDTGKEKPKKSSTSWRVTLGATPVTRTVRASSPPPTAVESIMIVDDSAAAMMYRVRPRPRPRRAARRTAPAGAGTEAATA